MTTLAPHPRPAIQRRNHEKRSWPAAQTLPGGHRWNISRWTLKKSFRSPKQPDPNHFLAITHAIAHLPVDQECGVLSWGVGKGVVLVQKSQEWAEVQSAHVEGSCGARAEPDDAEARS